tara:strand:+ start:69 stop:767 length:699 start_codon:yes stop_codon:yes gene_type:complete
MIVVILAGGKGTRISEYTAAIPKPMIKIGNHPIIRHLIEYYKSYGFKKFLVASGYKSKVLEDYFYSKPNLDVKVINTGKETLTGLRIKKLQKFINNQSFFLTYGDGLSNVNLKKLLDQHKRKKKILTLTAVHPPARFGEIEIKGGLVSKFEEKPQLQKGWINGGFFVCDPKIFNFIDKKNVMFERDPITKLVKNKQLAVFQHEGFWFCMDTLRDKRVLDNLYKTRRAPWIKK